MYNQNIFLAVLICFMTFFHTLDAFVTMALVILYFSLDFYFAKRIFYFNNSGALVCFSNSGPVIMDTEFSFTVNRLLFTSILFSPYSQGQWCHEYTV